MRTRIITSLAILFAVQILQPAQIWAANQFALNWHTFNHVNSCRGPGLFTEGQANFDVNLLPIPTYTVANSLALGALGSFNQDYQAKFSGALLRVGSNDIEFVYLVEGGDACVTSDETVRLRGPNTDRLLFQIKSAGSIVDGATDIDLTLREIDANLADSLDNLKRAIVESYAQIANMGAQADQTKANIDALQAELNDLLDLGFDEISPEQLDALLEQFDGLPQPLRDSLVAYLRDLQGDLAELRTEITRIESVFAERVDNVDGIGDGAPGFDPQDPGGFEPIATGDPPPIDIPEVLGDDPWNDSHDPYVKYADEVLETLKATVHDGAVVQRAVFLQIHGAWIYNIAALENILQRRATVTVREWGAFLDAKGRVLSYVEQFIDHDGWMRDAPASPQLRATISFLKDLDAAYHFKQRAEALQLAINLWNRDELTPRQNALLDILVVFDEAVRARMAQAAPNERTDGFWDTMEHIVDGVITVADIAVSFTPAGHLLDLCRAIGGKAQCVFGRDLSRVERVVYGAASVIGGASVWKAAASKLGGPSAGVVHEVGEVLGQVTKRTPKSGIVKVTPLEGGGVEYVHESGKVVRYSREGFPDFSPYKYKGTAGKAEVRITLSGSRGLDETAANAAAGFTAANPKPIGYTWHHHEEVGTMVLIETDAHKAFAHTGGFAIYNKIQELVGE